jgi:copper homeostasis protein
VLITFISLNIGIMLVEVCVTSIESALIAQQAGADRIELCAELSLGGITPSYGLIKTVKERLDIPVHVLIRPRSGDFTYSETEFDTMLEDIDMCRSLGVEGIVSGVLDSDFSIDWKRTEILFERSKGRAFTFHRAIDWVPEPLEAFLGLQKIGVNALLTSGQAASAEEGIEVLKALHALSDTCIVMPGGGIREHNASVFKKEGFRVLHLSGSRMVKNIPSSPPLPMRSSSFAQENEIQKADAELLRKVIESVN